MTPNTSSNYGKEESVRTNLDLDRSLVDEARTLTGITRLDELVRAGLRALIASRRRRNLNDLAGKIRFAPGYDHKRARGSGV